MTKGKNDRLQLRQNIEQLLTELQGNPPEFQQVNADSAKNWHSRILHNLETIDPEIIGKFRGERGLETRTAEVSGIAGVEPEDVASELRLFDRLIATELEFLDKVFQTQPEISDLHYGCVLDLCAKVHMEWVRIHPFADGNGKTARLWVNFIAMRYGIRPFLAVSPRPLNDYALISREAMDRQWKKARNSFESQLKTALIKGRL